MLISVATPPAPVPEVAMPNREDVLREETNKGPGIEVDTRVFNTLDGGKGIERHEEGTTPKRLYLKRPRW
jgi:hypothetical protein